MQRVTFVRYTAKPECADENERLSRAVFAELREKRPPGIAYTLCRTGDEFVHVFINYNADESESVTELASFKAFSAAGPDRWLAPADVVRLGVHVIEAYSAERMPATA
jgi:hypothetical protein